MPPPISDEASIYVGIHADIEIQSEAKLPTFHLRSVPETGARSGLKRGLL
jgi:hypothetical protein